MTIYLAWELDFIRLEPWCILLQIVPWQWEQIVYLCIDLVVCQLSANNLLYWFDYGDIFNSNGFCLIHLLGSGSIVLVLLGLNLCDLYTSDHRLLLVCLLHLLDKWASLFEGNLRSLDIDTSTSVLCSLLTLGFVRLEGLVIRRCSSLDWPVHHR